MCVPGSSPLEDHWALRRQAAGLLATIAAQFSAPHHNLGPRLCRVLAQAFLDPSKHLTSKYGAAVGLQVGGRGCSWQGGGGRGVMCSAWVRKYASGATGGGTEAAVVLHGCVRRGEGCTVSE